MSHSTLVWKRPAFDSVFIEDLTKRTGVPFVVAQILFARGIDSPEAIHDFFGGNPPKGPSYKPLSLSGLRDPADLPGCREVAEALHTALREKRRIVIYGDFDADGMTSTAILYRALKFFGGDVDYYIPDRHEEGYGLNAEALRHLKTGHDALTVITVDCGINSCREADLARELGIELLISDHHKIGPELPKTPIAHPELIRIDGRRASPYGLKSEQLDALPPEDRYPFSGLCAAGVALKIAWQLGRCVSGTPKVSKHYSDLLCRLIGLVGIGTVADVVPLRDENRALVRYALGFSLVKQPFPGIVALLEQAKIDPTRRALTSEDIAYTLAPLLNAAGRMSDARHAVELLICDDGIRAQELAETLSKHNEERKKRQQGMSVQAGKMIKEHSPDAPAFVLAHSDWDSGIIGVVAGRMADKHLKPCLLIAKQDVGCRPASGSGRSGGTIDLFQALESCTEYLLRYGGHAKAAGFRIENAKIDAFRKAFTRYVEKKCPDGLPARELRIDAEWTLGQAKNEKNLRDVELLEPFGAGNRQPIFTTKNVGVRDAKLMGKEDHEGKQRHICMQLVQDGVPVRAFAFDAAEWLDELAGLERIDVAFHISRSRYNRSIELQLVDWRRAET